MGFLSLLHFLHLLSLGENDYQQTNLKHRGTLTGERQTCETSENDCQHKNEND